MIEDMALWALPGTHFLDMAPTGGGKPYRLLFHAPPEEPPEEGWPLLVLTDGNACFPLAAGSMAVQAPYPLSTNVGKGVILAIGYPTDAPYDALRRSWDLGPPPGKTYPPFAPGQPPVVTGGAGALFDFIEHTLLPLVETKLRINRARRTFFGHSFGGLCALYGLFTRPDLFRHWISASPAIFWDDRAILGDEARRRPITGEKRFLHLSAGEFEGDDIAPFQIGQPDAEARLKKKAETRTVALAREMAVRLDRPEDGLSARFELHAGETHMSALPIAVHRAVQIAFALRG